MSFQRRIYDTSLAGIPELAFNNTYEVNYVSDQTRFTRDTLYTRCLEIQRRMCGINIIAGKMNEFIQNASLARTFDMPVSTYFKRIQNKFLYFFSEKECLYSLALQEDPITYPTEEDIANGYPFSPYYSEIMPKQGLQYRKYSLYDVCKKHNYFKRRLLFFICKNSTDMQSILYMDLIVIPTKTSTYLAIKTDGEGYFNKAQLDQLIDNQTDWFLYETKTGPYWKNDAYSASNIQTVEDHSYLLHNFTDTSTANKAVGSNAYLVCIPDEIPNTWKVTYGAYQEETEDHQAGYEVPAAFTNGFQDSKLLVFNEKDIGYAVNVLSRVNSTALLGSPMGIFQLPLLENPIPPENILCFMQNEETGTIDPLPQSVVTLWYPNVYKIENIDLEVEESNILVLAHYAEDATTKFTNPITNYMEYRGEQYINDCINGTLANPVATYVPYPDKFSIEDYKTTNEAILNRPYQYILNKDIWMLLDDPNRYWEIFHDVTTYLTRHNTYRYEIKASDTDIGERSVTTNSGQIKNTAKQITFNETMTYVVINTHSSEEIPVWIFVDGYRVTDPHVFVEGFAQYMYFPTSYLSTDSVITVEIMDVHKEDIIQAPLSFTEVGVGVPFPENFDHFADQNLTFYDADTMEIIPNSDFQYGIYVDIEKDHILTSLSEYLKTVNDEFVITGSRVKMATGNTGFYKNVGTRVSIQNIDMANTTIYATSYRDNSSIISNPVDQQTWDEDMLCFDIVANQAIYPITLEIDDTEIPSDKVYRYFQYDLTNQVMKEYVFFPKSYAAASSVIKLTTLIAQKWEFLKNYVSFHTTGELCIYTVNQDNIGRNIIVQATDFYEKQKWQTTDTSVMFASFSGDPKEDRFRFWEIDENGKGSRVENDQFMFTFSPNHGEDLIITSKYTREKEILVEYMPYRSKVCTTYSDISPDPTRTITFFDSLERPISLDTYEIYADGKLLDSSDYRAFTPTSIVLSSLDTTAKFVVVEKSHDPDVYGNRYRKMTLEEQLMQIDDSFKTYMREKAFEET